MPACIVWFRDDLRLRDHPALHAASRRGHPILPVYILPPPAPAAWPLGAAGRWWLHHSLKALDKRLRRQGSRLLLFQGHPRSLLPQLAANTGAEAIFWNRGYAPQDGRETSGLTRTLRAQGLAVETFQASLLFEPEALKTGAGTPYQVFTPFWRQCLRQPPPEAALSAPRHLPAPPAWPRNPAPVPLEALRLLPQGEPNTEFGAHWSPGEEGALRRLRAFLRGPLRDYPTARDRPDQAGTSSLSPHLRFGELSPRQVWHAVREQVEAGGEAGLSRGEEVFLKEMLWREFAWHLLWHFPHTTRNPLRPRFKNFPWRRDARQLRAWQQGLTGYPIVDAGMRQLQATGWMHNRVRMIVASFLVKDLLIRWQDGAAWFWKALVDADLGNNTLNWQWAAGCGADAAPFFRIFNPVFQGEKFDPQGHYVRRWIPELGRLSLRYLHQPWEAPAEELARGGVRLGEDYPRPLVDHGEARARALEAFAQIR